MPRFNHLPFIMMLLFAATVQLGCKSRGGVPNEPNLKANVEKTTLGDWLRPQYKVAHTALEISWIEDTTQVGENCIWIARHPLIMGAPDIQDRIRAVSTMRMQELTDACLTDSTLEGEGFFSCELGRADEMLLSLIVNVMQTLPGGKAHPESLSLQYSPHEKRELTLTDLFISPPTKLYPVLRKLVLNQIEDDQSLENAESVLFDDGKQTTEEVLRTFLVTKEGLIFRFGPSECRQLFWGLPMTVELSWDLKLDQGLF